MSSQHTAPRFTLTVLMGPIASNSERQAAKVFLMSGMKLVISVFATTLLGYLQAWMKKLSVLGPFAVILGQHKDHFSSDDCKELYQRFSAYLAAAEALNDEFIYRAWMVLCGEVNDGGCLLFHMESSIRSLGLERQIG